jgi:hypothetical protein
VTFGVTLTIVPPPCRRICGIAARQVAITPKVLVSKISRTTASGVVSKAEARPMPALFTSTSMAPKAATPSAIARSTLAASVTSSGNTRSRSDVPNISASGRRIVAITFQPRSRKCPAIALP